VRLAFTWEAGIKVIRVRLERKQGGWVIASAPYKRIEDGKDEGSCKNLFALAPTGGGGYALTFKRPPSLAWCEVISYGNEKKSHEYARLNSIGNRNVNKGDKNMFSADDEKKMGLEASTQFDQKYQMVTDPQIVGYVTRIAEKVVAASDQPKTQVHVRVVRTDDVNAFVTAGGHVYVFTGLIATAQNESQLAGVLAHEISHAIARHVTEGATRNTMAQGGAQIGSAVLGQLLGLGKDAQDLVTQGAQTSAGLITLKYDRKSESEADLLGAQYLWSAGWDPEAIARFFELFQKQGLKSSTPQWLSTHPSHEKRVENGIAWVRAFLPAKERYLVNTPEFEAVKAKVAKLPKPAPAAPSK
jgi:beta-barrel assembly-enhancing protease